MQTLKDNQINDVEAQVKEADPNSLHIRRVPSFL